MPDNSWELSFANAYVKYGVFERSERLYAIQGLNFEGSNAQASHNGGNGINASAWKRTVQKNLMNSCFNRNTMGVRHLQQLPRTVSRIRAFISGASRKTQLTTGGNIRSSSTQSSSLSFEPLPREDLVPRVMSRLKGRPFIQGSQGDGCPEYLAEPKESLPHAVLVHNPNQASLEELTIKCMEYVEDNIVRTPAILFRNLPAETAQDFSTIAKAIPWKGLEYKGSPNYRVKADKEAWTYHANEDPCHISIAPHNELSFTNAYPSKVCRIL